MSCVEEFGIYKNMIVVNMPDHMKYVNGGYYSSKDTLSIDPCIVDEIKYLWSKGIHTMNSCCGHGMLPPTVIVCNKSEKKMIDLGYKIDRSNDKFDSDTEKIWFLKSKHKRREKQ